MFRFAITVVLILTNGLGSAYSCIWHQPTPGYWPSNTIPVCFLGSDDSIRNERLALVITNALQEINTKTNFTLQGFDTCTATDPDQPQIRIRLSEENSGAVAFPNNRTPRAHNVLAPTGEYAPGRVMSEGFVAAQAMHEVLHMFGIQHNYPRDSKDFEPGRALYRDDHYVLGDYDPNSIMPRSSGENATDQFTIGSLLSDQDVQCMNVIATRDFPGHPDTVTAIEASTAASPSFEAPDATPFIDSFDPLLNEENGSID